MGRDVKIRESYQSDAAYLTRLARAVQKDPKRGVPWKKSVIELLNQLAVLFLQDTNRQNTKL